MNERHSDGSAGDANYGKIGVGYTSYRQPERRIAAIICRALEDARTVLNVGAGAGSYEPTDREVIPIEPSEFMRAQRPKHLPVAIDGMAEKIPFANARFDASMATFTVHQWADLRAGLSEMRRVTRGPVLILTCDPNRVRDFWLNDYAPEVLATEARRYPPLETIGAMLGGNIQIIDVPIPLLCQDGFNEAYYGRPEKLLEEGARLACSAWSFVDPAATNQAVGRLREDIATGRWDAKYGYLRKQHEYAGSLRLLVGRP